MLTQVVVVGLVVALFAWFAINAMDALDRRGISTGFDHLGAEAGFGIGEGMIAFSPADTYGRAFLVGLLNTFKVSIVSIVAATVLGVVLGFMRLSPNLGVAKLAAAYVELFRNTPQLLQIIFWYWLITRLPGPRQALRPFEGLFVSNRGIQLAWPVAHPGWSWGLWALAVGIAVALAWTWWAGRTHRRTGRRPPVILPNTLLVLGLPLAAWGLAGAPMALDHPVQRGFNLVGGIILSPEFTALFLGLSLYIAAFIAEIVRSGLQAVPRGQVDAARSLGLSRSQIYRLVLIPQALRVMVPPLAAQYVSLVKNSSLAVAIGYPDLVNISNTTINQTGHVVGGDRPDVGRLSRHQPDHRRR